jgi:hypothetical protein
VDEGERPRPGLDSRAEAAKEQSRKLYKELFPTFVSESTNAFAQLTDDPDTLEKFAAEMRQISESLQTLLNAEEEYAKELADSPYKQTVLDAFQRVKTDLESGFRLLWRGRRTPTTR